MQTLVIANVLDRLRNVKPRGNGRWLAQCPGPLHRNGDIHPSLSIGTGENGAVLLKCWVGCSAHDIVSAVGLDLADLFPPRESTGKPISRPWPAAQILAALLFEVEIVGLAASDLYAGKSLSTVDSERFKLAIERVLGIYMEVQRHV